jgi:dipeptidyl aminopeptidase/acylaminoacyl peptidase
MAEGQDTHGYVITPPRFKCGVNGKWPAVMLIHGGPESTWYDQWSTQWNPNGTQFHCWIKRAMLMLGLRLL